MFNHVILAIIIFVMTYVVIMSEKMNRTSVAVFGAVLLIISHVIKQDQALEHIDFNTIGLLVGMMIIVTIMKKTGIFQYVAIVSAKAAKGDPWRIIVFFSIITAVASALLANVTTMLLIVPITFVITETLDADPIPFLIPLILVANIGGTATLIGDPPNIMIGSATGFGFMDFIVNMTPIAIIVFIITMFMLKLVYKKSLHATEEQKQKIMSLDENLAVKDKKLLMKSLLVLLLTLIGFLTHEWLGYHSATVALFGAGLLMLITKKDPEEILLEVEWPTIFFFMALFVLVGGLEEVGAIDFLAEKLILLTHGNLVWTMILILWTAAIASAFIDNIPFVATMIPLIKSIAVISTISVTPLWWALALGACLGGNGTLIGSSSNLVVSGMLEKKGRKLGFGAYMKIGFPIMLVTVLVSMIYLMVFYI